MNLSPSIEADAEHLLTSSDFTKEQYGMAVEAADSKQGSITIRTTGAEFRFTSSTGELILCQRLGRERTAARVTFPQGYMTDLKIEGRESGAVLLSARNGSLKLRINSDSLLMLKDAELLTLSYSVAFLPALVRQFAGNVMLFDEYGCVGSYCATGPETAPAVTGNKSVTHQLAANQILWLSVGPPKPFPWKKSLCDRVMWHWSKETGYPSDKEIEDWSRSGNLLLQQSEVMLWKEWNFRFIPRFGTEEFQRVVQTCRRFGMRNFVYTSPFYFLVGTGLENKAMNTFENFKGFSPGDGRGLNWPLFIEEIRRVFQEYRPGGLYFDGIYNNIVRTYLLARKAREVVGDDGVLEYHATLNDGPCAHTPPGGHLYLPQIDAYFDFILRGEGQHDDYKKDEFLRYSVSTYNISNSIGALCNNYNYKVESPFIDRLLDFNIRLHCLPMTGEEQRKLLEKSYWPKLNESLRARVEAAAATRSEK